MVTSTRESGSLPPSPVTSTPCRRRAAGGRPAHLGHPVTEDGPRLRRDPLAALRRAVVEERRIFDAIVPKGHAATDGRAPDLGHGSPLVSAEPVTSGVRR